MNVVNRFVPTRRMTHRRISPWWLLSALLLALTLLAGCMPVQPVAPDKAITLRMGVPDGEDVARVADYVHEFVEQAHTLSQGKITIEPVWNGGDGTFAGYEQGVIQRVLTGKYDLGLAASRAFDSQSITVFQALQAPFLITDDALAEAVATSKVATGMLDGLKPLGVVGLTMWPEDLRHPFSVMPDKPVLSPTDFAGLHVRATPSDITYQLISAMNATPMFEDAGYEVAESGLRQVGNLTGKPIATGNVTFFSKFQVIFANADAFNRLSAAQRALLQQAATAAQTKALAEHPQEVDAATAFCADGGTIALASDEQVAAFEKAAQPVFDNLAQDPLNAEMIAAIRELKAHTTPSAGASACAPVETAQSPAPSADTQVWSAGLPPNGAWQVQLTTDDLLRMGELKSVAAASSGVITITFQDGNEEEHYQRDSGETGGCKATYAAVENFVRLTYHDSPECTGAVEDIQWRIDNDGLHLHLFAIKDAPEVENRAGLEAKPWQKVD